STNVVLRPSPSARLDAPPLFGEDALQDPQSRLGVISLGVKRTPAETVEHRVDGLPREATRRSRTVSAKQVFIIEDAQLRADGDGERRQRQPLGSPRLAEFQIA